MCPAIITAAFHQKQNQTHDIRLLGCNIRSVSGAVAGSVVIRNWRPLPFDKIAESPHMTVGDILGELTNLATLRIQIFRYYSYCCCDNSNRVFPRMPVQYRQIGRTYCLKESKTAVRSYK